MSVLRCCLVIFLAFGFLPAAARAQAPGCVDASILLDVAPAEAGAASFAILSQRIRQGAPAQTKAEREGDSRIRVSLANVSAERVDEVIGLLTRGGAFSFNLVDDKADPKGFTPGEQRGGRLAAADLEDVIRVVAAAPFITNVDIADAYAFIDQYSRPAISLRLNAGGAKKLADVTTHNVRRDFAKMADGRILGTQTIHSPILDGGAQITDGFTIGEAEQLAVLIRSPALPAKVTIVERKETPSKLPRDACR